MTTRNILALLTGFDVACAAVAKVPAEKAAELDGPTYTCACAERAGSASGVAEYTGKHKGDWPGAKLHGWDPGPYKDEKPLFSITAENMVPVRGQADRGAEGPAATSPARPAPTGGG